MPLSSDYQKNIQAENKNKDNKIRPYTAKMPKYLQFSQIACETKEEQLDRLYGKKKSNIQNQQIKLALQKEQEFIKNCTFQPIINDNVIVEQQEYQDRHKKLYYDGIQMIKEKEKLQKIHEEEQISRHSFKPQINLLNFENNDDITPIYQRTAEILKQKQLRLQQKITEKQQQENYKFQPQLNKITQDLAQNYKEQNIFDRLTRNDKKEYDYEHYDFVPNIGEKNKQIDFVDDLKNFNQRQKYFQEQQEVKQKLLEQKVFQDVNFKPQINQISQFLVQMNNDNENKREVYDRLSSKKPELKGQELLEYTFIPKINKKSQKMARSHSLNQLAYEKFSNPEKTIQKLMEYEMESTKELLFKPQINQNVKKLKSEYCLIDLTDNVKSAQVFKDKKIEMIQYEKCQQELLNCTFKPKINKFNKNSFQSQVMVQGLNQFLHFKDLQQKKNKELEKKKEDLFHLEKKYRSENHQGFTIPKPFNLSKKTSQQKLLTLEG